MTFVVFSALVGFVGLVVFLLPFNPIVKQIGFGCFVAGLAATMVTMGVPVRGPGHH